MFVPEFKNFTPERDLESLAESVPNRLADLAPKDSSYTLAIHKDECANYTAFIKVSSSAGPFTGFETSTNPKFALIEAEIQLRRQLDEWRRTYSKNSCD